MAAALVPFAARVLPTNTPGPVYTPGVRGPDLLTALMDFLRNAEQLRLWVGTGYGEGAYGALGYDQVKVWDEQAPQEASYPFLVLTDYDESGPGLTAEDFPIRVTVNAASTSLDQARLFGATVKRLLDPVNLNPAAFPRRPLAWARGVESYNTRNDSRPRRMGLGRDGVPVFLESIDYTFIVDPYQ